MKCTLGFFLCLLCAVAFSQTPKQTLPASGRQIPFDKSWLFMHGEISNADQPAFNDEGWRKIDLPHDWSIEDLPNQDGKSIIGPFSEKSVGTTATGYTLAGTGWYRKKFQTTKSMQGKKLTIFFDGVYMNSDVWLNGQHLGNHPYGYTPFYYDLTPYLKPTGEENVLAVSVKNEGRNSRWYSGSGIYRHVWLTVTDATHFSPWGVYVTTPDASKARARVSVSSSLNNDQPLNKEIDLVIRILSPEGKMFGMSQQTLSLNANSSATNDQTIEISNPTLWSVENPSLYKAITEIREGNKILDRVETTFGIRSLSFSATNGFLLNGKKVLLKGGCIHHDNGPLGAIAIDRGEQRKIEILKKNGFNAIRTSHNPPSTALLDACDRLGMLVLDEAFDAWQKGKNPNDYHVYFKDWCKSDIDAMVMRDRNHPSIIFWSIGNEIIERSDSSGLRITKELRAEVRRMDTTRPVTEALCLFWDNPGYQWDTTAGAYALLDVGGYNYTWQYYESDHKKFPDRMMLGTESYPVEALASWNKVENLPYVLGDFVWTAFDYMGEASIGHSSMDSANGGKFWMGWPWFNGYCGDIDLIGNKKPQSYYRDVIWRNSAITMLVHAPIPNGFVEHVSGWGWPDESPSWTWPGSDGKTLSVRVFSRAESVRLYLNGKLIDEHMVPKGTITAIFKIPYQPGTLKAVNVNHGKEGDSFELKTTERPKRIRLVADRTKIHADQNDLSYVTVEITDEQGQVVPNAEVPVLFSLSGAGRIAGLGNGNPSDMASFQGNSRKTWRGRCLVIIQPKDKPGEISLKASAEGLEGSSINISSK